MLSSLILGLTTSSNQTHYGEILGVIRDILGSVAPHTQAHLAALAGLPGFGAAGAAAFMESFGRSSKETEQKNAIKLSVKRMLGAEAASALLDDSGPGKATITAKPAAMQQLNRKVKKVPAATPEFENQIAEAAANEIFASMFD